jgi:hypothetical protein
MELGLLTIIVACTNILLSAGVWTPDLFKKLFPKSTVELPITSLAGHSLLVRKPHVADRRKEEVEEPDKCHAIFASDCYGFSPELFSRAGDEIFIAGLNSTAIKPPAQASSAKPNRKAIETLKKASMNLLDLNGQQLEIRRESLVCYTWLSLPFLVSPANQQSSAFDPLPRTGVRS